MPTHPYTAPVSGPGSLVSQTSGGSEFGGTITHFNYRMTGITGSTVVARAHLVTPPGTAPANGWPLIAACHGADGLENGGGVKESLLGVGDRIDITTQGVSASSSADQQTAIQNAINAATAGSTLYFPPGNYRHSGNLTVNKELTLLGAPGTTLTATTVTAAAIRLTGDGAAIKGFTVHNSAATSRHSNDDTRAGISVFVASDIVIENCTVTNAAAASIFIDSGSNFIVKGCTVQSGHSDSIHMTGFCSDGLVENNEVFDSGDDCYAVVTYLGQNNRGITIRNNSADTGDARGVAVVGGTDVVIENNTITNTRGAGIYIASEPSYGTDGVDRVVVRNNTLDAVNYDAGLNHGGIFIWAGETGEWINDITIEGNTVTDTIGGAAHLVVLSPLSQETDLVFTDNTTSGAKPHRSIGAPSAEWSMEGSVHNGSPVADKTPILTAAQPSQTMPTLPGEGDLPYLLAAGYAVVFVDNEGLNDSDTGNTIPNPYMNRNSAGRGVIDACRAVGSIISISGHCAAWGYSQGGAAALAAGELHREGYGDLHGMIVAAVDPVHPEDYASANYSTVPAYVAGICMGVWYEGRTLDLELIFNSSSATNIENGSWDNLDVESIPATFIANPASVGSWQTALRDNSFGYGESPPVHIWRATSGIDPTGSVNSAYASRAGGQGTTVTVTSVTADHAGADDAAATAGVFFWIVDNIGTEDIVSGSSVTGTIAWTEADDTASAAGSHGVAGTSSWTEADDTLAASGTAEDPTTSGTAAWAEASDTVAGSGTFTYTQTVMLVMPTVDLSALATDREAHNQGMTAGGRRFGEWFGTRPAELSVLKIDGAYTSVRDPTDEQIAAATEVYRAGRIYELTADQAAGLASAGYTVAPA